MITRDLTLVTNTYPVFLKATTENEQGIHLTKTLSEIKKDGYTSTRKYYDEFNSALNRFVLDCFNSACEAEEYYKYEGQRPNEYIRFYKIDSGYYLMILQAEPYTILLNYEQVDDAEVINKIPMIPNYNVHVRNHRQNNKTFKVTNTYNAFLNYASLHNTYPNLSANAPFFNCFFDSIKDVDLSKRYGKIRFASDVNEPKTNGRYNYFYYIVEEDNQNDIVIIVDYFQTMVKIRNDLND